MNILVIGAESNQLECRQKFGNSHQYVPAISHGHAIHLLGSCDLVFDFLAGDDPSAMNMYRAQPAYAVFLNTSKTSLERLNKKVGITMPGYAFGFAGLPTFLNREILEVSVHQPDHLRKLSAVCRELNTEFRVVADQVGLVTPRVICMIINEAYFAVQEGTATREDIDLAMKLGTNYPFGPFEWCKRIGIKHVYELLEAVSELDKDRYGICPLMEHEYVGAKQTEGV